MPFLELKLAIGRPFKNDQFIHRLYTKVHIYSKETHEGSIYCCKKKAADAAFMMLCEVTIRLLEYNDQFNENPERRPV